ncbi:hypothetical protein A2V71_01725 [Candidatus Berkelbacteria bacterium RBG_13_40_8]|uniref:Type II secretion system protein GspI C-terminal domain-containing protein n=1 Tax=Candidatus Berkelbacteria bacterium RBG_13_40_8 TaxID=1797467 RepID=A0A1F5DPT7_9BACT|nr:MAG: hypothetical protein A2V71_01725 [Candidatus Berkelbacteria bacterium RBG_13_40_8]
MIHSKLKAEGRPQTACLKAKLKRGFTLIEVVVATGILLVGVLGVGAFFATSSTITRHASYTSIASNLAQGFIDEEISKSYDELDPGTGPKARVSDVASNPFYNYWKQVNITLIDSDLANSGSDIGLKKIDIFVFWQEGSSEKNIQLSTVKTNR